VWSLRATEENVARPPHYIEQRESPREADQVRCRQGEGEGDISPPCFEAPLDLLGQLSIVKFDSFLPTLCKSAFHKLSEPPPDRVEHETGHERGQRYQEPTGHSQHDANRGSPYPTREKQEPKASQ